MHLARLSALLLVASLATAPAVAETAGLDPLARRALHAARTAAPRERLAAEGVALDAARSLDVFVMGSASRAALEAAGARVRTELPGLVTAHVPADAVARVAALPGVTLVRGAARVAPLLETSVPATGATPQRGLGPEFAGVNGAGVVIGVVDTGVDLEHPDFRDANGATRILRAWDQTDAAGPRPGGYGYGTEWTATEIDGRVARMTDDDGHGTHVLGIAAGDGSATGGAVPAHTYVGMAPRADLMVVKAEMTDTAILDGVAWVMSRAAALGKPAVVNLSVGSLFGPKDGTSPFEQGIDALTGPGRIVVLAAGNHGGSAAHAETALPAGATRSVTLQVSGSAPGAIVAIDGYYDGTGYVTMTVTAPSGVAYGPIAMGGWNASYPGALTACGELYFENGAVVTALGDREIYAELRVPSPNPFGLSVNGTWTLTFQQVGGAGTLDVDAWVFHANVPANFVLGNRPDRELIAEPGNAARAITTGAWVTKNRWTDCGGRNVGYADTPVIGDLAAFSSPGPTRDGRQKPDVAAPGQGIGSATSFDVAVSCPPGPSALLGDGMRHWVYEGTSMAAPHVTGAVALILHRRGPLDPDQVKAHLFAQAIRDGFTGAAWNPRFGHGKLAVGDLTAPVARVFHPNGGERLASGSVATLAWSATDLYGPVTQVDIELARVNGGPYEALARGIPNTGSYAWTVTGPPTAQARLRVTARDGGGNSAVDVSDGLFAIAGPLAAPSSAAVAEWSLALVSANPSGGPLEVELTAPRAGPVELAVHDLAGRRVATLARAARAAGRERFRWSPEARHASGIYFVRLRAPDRVITVRAAIAR